MNKRIKELANQAGFNPVNYMGGNSPLFEAFAHLILEEAISQIESEGEKIRLQARMEWDGITRSELLISAETCYDLSMQLRHLFKENNEQRLD